MYYKEDIGIVIPTYNRSMEVEKTLDVLFQNKNIPGAIYIMDQSNDNRTKKIVQKYKKNFPKISYIKIQSPSTSKASNTGIELAKKKFKLILMLDDDIDCFTGFLDGILYEFNNNKKIYGLSGEGIINIKKNQRYFNNMIKKIILNSFFLPNPTNIKLKVLGPYGNTGHSDSFSGTKNAEWLPGVFMCYKREVFDNYKIPESRGYNLLQDIDLSYYVFRKYGKGSLIVTDKAKYIHRFSQIERYPNHKLAFVNQEDRFIFYYRHFHNLIGTLKLIWSVFGLILIKITLLIFKPNKKNFLKLKYFLKSLFYCIKNRKNIKNRNYRLFLNEDLSLKDI